MIIMALFLPRKSIKFHLVCLLNFIPHRNPIRKVENKSVFLPGTSDVAFPDLSFIFVCRLFILSNLVSKLKSIVVVGNNTLASPSIFRSYVHWGSVETGKQTEVSNVHIEYAGFYEKLLLFSNPYLEAFE